VRCQTYYLVPCVCTLPRCLNTPGALSLQAVLLPPPRPLQSSNYARVVNQVLRGSGTSAMQLWLRIPLLAPDLEAAEGTRHEDHAAQVMSNPLCRSKRRQSPPGFRALRSSAQ
jgi:hypothetical protein